MTAPQSVLGPPLVPTPGQLSWEQMGWQEPPVSLVSEGSFSALGVQADARGYFVVHVEPPPAHYRGRLGLFLEEAIEAALEARGALAPGIQSTTGLDASLADQLYRTRLLGHSGLAILIPTLEGIANLGRVLDADDSSVLRWWIAASMDRPVRLLIHEDNSRLRVYQAPVMFDALFGVSPGPVSPRAPSVEMAESAESMELSDLPPQVVAADFETSVAGTRAEIEDSSEFSALERALGLEPSDEAQRSTSTWPCPPEFPPSEAPAKSVASDDVGCQHAETPIVQASLFVDTADTDVQERWLNAEEISPSDVALVSSPSPGPARLEVGGRLEAGGPTQQEPAAANAQREPSSLGAPGSGTPSAPRVRFSAADFYAAQSGEGRPRSSAPKAAGSAEPEVLLSSPDSAAGGADGQDVGQADQQANKQPESTGAFEAGPTPLPTKKISHNPFVRFAEPHEGVAPLARLGSPDVGALAPGASSEPSEVPSELPVRVVPKRPIVQGRDPRLAQTLREAPEPDEFEEDDVAPRLSQRPTLPSQRPTVELSSDEAAVLRPSEPEALPASEPQLAPAKESPRTSHPADAERQAAFVELARRDWRAWLAALEGARGPKPLSAVERMFVTDYTRLVEAHRLGIADDTALEAIEHFRTSFAESYSEAFDALRARGKRPTMVLDLPDMAHRIARLQGARRVQLLLIDGLRFDLGLMLQDRLKREAEATLTERLLLWSALPTCTSYQLELLGKGPEGLQEPGDPEEPPALVARGRAAMTPRRVRTGSLELYKLDVVEDELREVGASVRERLPLIADRTAEAVLEFFAKQPPKTMVVVFGDHGFALDPSKAGTSAEVIQGGSSPEEVLVPAFAWLTGKVH